MAVIGKLYEDDGPNRLNFKENPRLNIDLNQGLAEAEGEGEQQSG